MLLSGKRVVVTGGTDGIGAALVKVLCEKGAAVIATGRTPARIASMRGTGIETIEADLSAPAGIGSLIAALRGREIDILINNAGAGVSHDFRGGQPDAGDVDPGIFLNLNAPIHLITHLMPALLARPAAMIVNVTSGLAIAPYSGGPVYCASKAALRTYTMALRRQLQGTSVHVLEALPPLVATKMNASRQGRMMSAEACARAIVRAMERDADEANVGLVKVLRTVYSISPALARKIMIRF